MKLKNILFAILALFFSLSAFASGESFDLNIISFNIRLDSSSDGDYRWDKRKETAAAMVNRESPDIMGLQEAQPHQIAYLAKECQGYGWYGLGRDTGLVPGSAGASATEECMAVFYKKDLFEILDKGTFWLSPNPSAPGKGWDAGYNRTCTWVLFRNVATGGKFYFFNTHLDDSGETAREESIKLIVSRIKSINKAGLPIFLMADFNSDTTDKIFDPLHKLLKDARAEAPMSDNKPTYNAYDDTPGVRLDHIFYNGVESITGFKTLTGNYGIRYVSDHYPVEAKFTLK